MTNRRSDNYVCTVHVEDPEYKAKIDLVRKTVSKANRPAKERGESRQWTWRVLVKGRLGNNNPDAHLYRVGGPLHRHSAICIRPEHSTRFDVYITKRYSWR